jgi:hypothetical protein
MGSISLRSKKYCKNYIKGWEFDACFYVLNLKLINQNELPHTHGETVSLFPGQPFLLGAEHV